MIIRNASGLMNSLSKIEDVMERIELELSQETRDENLIIALIQLKMSMKERLTSDRGSGQGHAA